MVVKDVHMLCWGRVVFGHCRGRGWETSMVQGCEY